MTVNVRQNYHRGRQPLPWRRSDDLCQQVVARDDVAAQNAVAITADARGMVAGDMQVG